MGAAAIYAGVAAATALMSGIQGAKQAKYQARVAQQQAEYNARLAENEAVLAQQAATVEEERHRDNLRRFVASQRAAASGIVTDSGSAGLLVEEAVAEGERDALGIRYSGSVEAARSTAEAAAQRYRGESARRAGSLGAASAILSGIGGAARALAPLGKSGGGNPQGIR